jgi:hypothetical protein
MANFTSEIQIVAISLLSTYLESENDEGTKYVKTTLHQSAKKK